MTEWQGVKATLHKGLLAYRDGFVVLLPVIILGSIITLAGYWLPDLVPSTASTIEPLQGTIRVGWIRTLHFVALLSISICLAHAFGEDAVMAAVLGFTAYTTVLLIELSSDQARTFLNHGAPVIAILLPAILMVGLRLFRRVDGLSKRWLPGMETLMAKSLRQTPRFVVCYLWAVGVAMVLLTSDLPGNAIAALGDWAAQMNTMVGILIRVIINQLFWALGIHGSLMIDAIIPAGMLDGPIAGADRVRKFYLIVANLGGTGMGLSLILAIFLSRRDAHMRNVAKAAMPFSVFNINEVLIFGLPIALNPYLILPFVLVPVVNITVGAWLFDWMDLRLVGATPSFVVPPLINGWLATDGDIRAPLIQLVMIALGTAIYLPFVRRYARVVSWEQQYRRASASLAVGDSLNPITPLHTHSFQQSQSDLIELYSRVDALLKHLDGNHLTVHYQPRICLRTRRINGYEALLRLDESGIRCSLMEFLMTFERAGMTKVLDMWVCRRVAEDIGTLRSGHPDSVISINVHPDSLRDMELLEWLVSNLSGRGIELEIVERGFVNSSATMERLTWLRKHGFRIAIDDFGTGNSNLSMLRHVKVDAIKLDRSLVVGASEGNARVIFEHACSMCRGLGKEVIAEGVETAEELRVVLEAGVEVAQGWYFAKAMPLREAIAYRLPVIDLANELAPMVPQS